MKVNSKQALISELNKAVPGKRLQVCFNSQGVTVTAVESSTDLKVCTTEVDLTTVEKDAIKKVLREANF